MNIIEHFEEEARQAAAQFCESELKRLAPLAELDLELSERNMKGSKYELDDRDISLILCLKYIEEKQNDYRALPGDVTPVIDFIEKTREKIVNILASRPYQYLN